jgi:hypothetical protein
VRPTLLLVTLLASAQAAQADPVEVISPQADGVSVTIYRDLFALITETRTVDLPEGPVTLSFDGVVETLLPESAVVTDLGRALEERNFDYDPLSPNSLLTRSIGKTVTITRTMPGAGRVVQSRAVIVAANEGGITLRTEDGNEALHCSGLPERLTFDEVPDDLHARPRLSIRLAAGNAGKRTIRLSYLAQGFTWKADYIARLNSAGNRMDLTGWVTLRNYTQASFRGAKVQVVAGKLHLVDKENGGSSLVGDSDYFSEGGELDEAREEARQKLEQELEPKDSTLQLFSGCHALPEPETRDKLVAENLGRLDMVIVTGRRASLMSSMDMKREAISVEREELGDYQLYRLPWATDLNARQTKQAVFLAKPHVKIDRYYSYIFNAQGFENEPGDSFTPTSTVAFDNRKTSGLGEPLPGGMVRLFEGTATGEVFMGEARMSDKPVNVPVELDLANALDFGLTIDVAQADSGELKELNLGDRADVDLRAFNAKGVPVTLEFRQYVGQWMGEVTIPKSSRPAHRKYGDYAWRLRVPANSSRSLTYRLETPVAR